jgi:hypothetical protein
MVLHGINRVPRARFEHHVTRDLRIRTSRHGHEMDTPRHHAVDRHGMQKPLSRLQPSRLNLAALREDAAKPRHLPAASKPLHHRTRTRAIRHWHARAPQPCQRLLSLWWFDRLRLDGRHVDRWQCASRPTCPINRDPLGRRG